MSGKLRSAHANAGALAKTRRMALLWLVTLAVLGAACSSTSNVVETSVESSAGAGSESGTNTTVDQSQNNAPATSATPAPPLPTAPPQPTSRPAPTAPPARPTAVPTPTNSGSGNNGTNSNNGTGGAVGIGTCPPEFIGSGSYIVTNIAANDPDGGLIGHTAPGVDAPETGVLPADFGVWVDGTPESCAVADNGAVWWAVHVGEGIYDWVNAYYLGYYEGPGNRPVVGGNQLCDSYQWLLDAQETDIPVTKALINIDVELGAHPAGVSNAIYNMVNGFSTDWYGDLSTITDYVGPICATSTVSPNPPGVELIANDAEYWAVVEICWFESDPASCDRLEASGYGSDDSWGLGNSVGMTPWEFAVENCASTELYAAFYCRETWSRYDLAVSGTSKDYLGMCGDIATLALDPTKPIYHLDWALTFFSWDPDTSNAIASIYDGTDDGTAYDKMRAAFAGQCDGWF